MQEKYKYMFLKYIYNKLNLEKIENEITKRDIKPIDDEVDGLYKNISKYFSLVNKVDESRLSTELKNQYNNYFSLPLEMLIEEKMQNEVFNFLESTYKIMLFPNIKENHCFYGPLNYKYVAPRDSIVLGFNYEEFDIPEENFDELYSKQEEFISGMINYIQFGLAEEEQKTIAVIKYNEYSKKKVR
ncbi:MAG: hypothetical protein IJY25_01025 [Bacilli bacterium]|nr:hypothetical protein [Bacilli bacterium]